MGFSRFLYRAVRQRVPEKKEPATILVKTCTDPVAVKTYEDLKTLIKEHYPGVTFTFEQETYPLPVWRDVRAFSFHSLQGVGTCSERDFRRFLSHSDCDSDRPSSFRLPT